MPADDLAPVLGPRFQEALAYAADVHATQRRKGGPVPYIAHLLGVASLVIEDAAEAGCLDEDQAVAALLHDAAEDQGGERRLDDIRARFGARVAQMVRALSDSLEEPGVEKAPWRARKEAYLRDLAGEGDVGVLRVSLADKLYNARAVLRDHTRHGERIWLRFNRDSDPLWYYRALADLFQERLPGGMADQLVGTVEALCAQVQATPAPIPGARWVRRGRLLAGPHPGAADDADARAGLAALQAAGIGLIVDLTGDPDGLPPYEHLLGPGLARHHEPVASGCAPEGEALERVLAALDRALDESQGVYVHCRGGGGRTQALLDAAAARMAPVGGPAPAG